MDGSYNRQLKQENIALKECLWTLTSTIKPEESLCDKTAFLERIFTNMQDVINFLQISDYITVPKGAECNNECDHVESSGMTSEDEQQNYSSSTNLQLSQSKVIYDKSCCKEDELCNYLSGDGSSSCVCASNNDKNNNNKTSICETAELKDFPKICRSCQKLVEDPYSLNRHFMKCCLEHQVACGICISQFDRRKDLLAHISCTHKLNGILCFTCFDTFCDDHNYVQHQTSHEAPVLRCGKCLDDVIYPTVELFMAHLQHHPLSVCGLCLEDTLNIASLTQHLWKKHHVQLYGKENYKENSCEVCLIKLSSVTALEEHLGSTAHFEAVQASIKPCSCQFCGESFPGRLQVVMHMKKEHKRQKRIYPCPHCDYTAAKMSVLLRHTQLHFCQRDIVCDQCGAAFYEQSTLQKHFIYKHSDIRPFSCNVCGERFKLKSSVRKHMLSHGTQRDVICSVCGADFKNQTHLRKHTANVHGLGPKELKLRCVKLVDVAETFQYSKGRTASFGEIQPLKYLQQDHQAIRRRKRRKSLRNEEYLQKLHENT